MNKRTAKREARAMLAGHARALAGACLDSPDGRRLHEAFSELAEFLEPAVIVVPDDPNQARLVHDGDTWRYDDAESSR